MQQVPLAKAFSLVMHELRRHLAVLGTSAETIQRFATHPTCKDMADIVMQSFKAMLHLTNEELGKVRKTVEAHFPLPEWDEEDRVEAPAQTWNQPLDVVAREIAQQLTTSTTRLYTTIQPMRQTSFEHLPESVQFIDELLERAMHDFLDTVAALEEVLIPRVRLAYRQVGEEL
jgi:hypothetical protein